MAVKDRLPVNFDEEILFELALSFVLGLAVTVSLVLVFTPIHELLHMIGAVLEGGKVVFAETVWIDFSAWIQTYIHPVVAANGELGKTTVQLPSNPLFGTAMFYFLPYIVLFPVSFYLMLGDNTRYLHGGEGISNLWRIVGGPLFILNFGAFWTDYALFTGSETAFVPFPAVVWQMLYFGVIVMGVVGSTIWLYFIRE